MNSALKIRSRALNGVADEAHVVRDEQFHFDDRFL